jgi:hypothetical protein
MGYGSNECNVRSPPAVGLGREKAERRDADGTQRHLKDLHPAADDAAQQLAVRRGPEHVVALQVAFERQTLKPVFSLDML